MTLHWVCYPVIVHLECDVALSRILTLLDCADKNFTAIVTCLYSIKWSGLGAAHLGKVVLTSTFATYGTYGWTGLFFVMSGTTPSHNCLSLWIGCTAVISSVGAAANDFICLVVASLALHVSIAFWNVRSGSFSNLLRVLSHRILQTTLSRIKPSLRSWNSQVCAFF